MTRPTDDAAQRPALRLPPVKTIPVEEMTFRQRQEASQANQAMIGLEHEVRSVAKELDLDAKEAEAVVVAARGGFRIVNGEPIPVAADRQTVIMAADGVNVMSVRDWVRRKARSLRAEAGGQPRGGDGRFLAGEDDEEVLPMRNPFKRKTWNVTEQMRLLRRDPRLARRLKAEAVASGEN